MKWLCSFVGRAEHHQIARLWRENADLNGIEERFIGGNTRLFRQPSLKYFNIVAK